MNSVPILIQAGSDELKMTDDHNDIGDEANDDGEADGQGGVRPYWWGVRSVGGVSGLVGEVSGLMNRPWAVRHLVEAPKLLNHMHSSCQHFFSLTPNTVAHTLLLIHCIRAR